MLRLARTACFVVATVAVAGVAGAQSPVPTPQSSSPSPSPSALSLPSSPTVTPSAAAPGASASSQPKPALQGIAVLAIGNAREEAFALARALYGTRLRPVVLDEVRARVLAGDPPPGNASRELRELAEVRAAVSGEDAAGRRLLAGLAQQVGAEALIVVKVERAAASSPAAAPPEGNEAPPEGNAGPAGSSPPAGNAAAAPTVIARLFLTQTGEFDAARYSPEPDSSGAAAWRSTVASLEARFPAASRAVGPAAASRPAPATLRPDEQKSAPFYASGWFWGALGAAALLGGAFYLASQDTSSDPIHLQMRVPR